MINQTPPLSAPEMPPVSEITVSNSTITISQLQASICRPYKSLTKISNNTDNSEEDIEQFLTRQPSLKIKVKPKKSGQFFNYHVPNNNNKSKCKLPSITKNKQVKSVSAFSQRKAGNLIKDPFLNGRITNHRYSLFSKMAVTSEETIFLKTVQSMQYQFLDECLKKRYKNAEQIIFTLLNYCIDLDLIKYFTVSVMILGDLNYQCCKNEQSFFFYNEARKCAYMTDQFQLMINAIMKMALCASRSNMCIEGIKMLKKALQYVWYHNLEGLQIKIYDEIGKMYYIMGNPEKAIIYHHKFFQGHFQQRNSSIRILSHQSLLLQGYPNRKKQKFITNVFLWMVQIPLKNCEELPEFKSPHLQRKLLKTIRKQHSKDMKYFGEFKSVKQSVLQILKEDFLKNQIGEIANDNSASSQPLRSRKFLTYDIQRNKHLQSLGIPFQHYFSKSRSIKINPLLARKFIGADDSKNQQKTSKNFDVWFKNIADETASKNRNFNGRKLSKVQIRGIDKFQEPKLSAFRIIYQQYFQQERQNKNQSI